LPGDGAAAGAEVTGPASQEPGSGEDAARAGDGAAAGAEVTGPASQEPGSGEDGIGFDLNQNRSRIARIKSFVRRGLTPTVIVLALLGAAVTVYAVQVLPDTAIPKPAPSQIGINFSSGHPTSSSIKAAITLTRGIANSHGDYGIILDVELAGADLAHNGWSIHMIMPTGVRLDLPSTGRVGRSLGGNAQNMVVFNPGPQADQKFSALLFWNDLHSGPVQIHGANLSAWFPDIILDNQNSGSNNGTPSVPKPQLSVTRALEEFGDIAYVGGQSPDQIKDSIWSWKTVEPIPVNEGGGILSPGVRVEARNVVTEQLSSNAVFRGGIAFGIAASALIAAIQEFVKSATENGRRTRRNHPAA
jgi:hypothetical protein